MIKILLFLNIFSNLLFTDINYDYLDSQIDISESVIDSDNKEYTKLNYFNGEDAKTISKKIEKYLNSTLNGKASFVVEYSLKKGIDPYLVSGVILQETGCVSNCSKLVKNCNNVGGNKGKPSCNGGSYRKFDTIEDGIKFAVNKLNSYYKKGLKTAKEINPHYAGDKTWYVKVNRYMNKMKSVKIK